MESSNVQIDRFADVPSRRPTSLGSFVLLRKATPNITNVYFVIEL